MTPEDNTVFFRTLSSMGLLFSDEMTKPRQKLYWDLMQDVTIEEWLYACEQAMRRETFHKVPLPAHLLDYVREYRKNTRQSFMREERADGSHTDAQLLQLREPLVCAENVRRLIRTIWPAYETTEENTEMNFLK